MKYTARLVGIFLCFSLGPAIAGTQALGFELGVSTIDQVRVALRKQTNLTELGTNRYSKGLQFKTDGASYDIEGLIEVKYVFDEQKKLAGILLKMKKARFDSVMSMLAGKYKIARQDRPFVGDQSVRFSAPDAVIELDSPHMSFEMDVSYIHNDLLKAFSGQSAAEAEAKRKREAAKF